MHQHAITPRIAAMMRDVNIPFVLSWSLPETWDVFAENGIDQLRYGVVLVLVDELVVVFGWHWHLLHLLWRRFFVPIRNGLVRISVV